MSASDPRDPRASRPAGGGRGDDWHATALTDTDNVATMLRPVAAGEPVVVRAPAGEVGVIAGEAIALCHKIALCDIAAGGAIVKYGECIGEATVPIVRGAWVHTHNLRSRRAQVPAPDAG